MHEKFNSSETEHQQEGRLLEGEERERAIRDRREYLEGLREMLTRTDLSEEERREAQEQYDGLKEFLEGMEAGETVRILKAKK